jgi:hypothetical protein
MRIREEDAFGIAGSLFSRSNAKKPLSHYFERPNTPPFELVSIVYFTIETDL